MFWLNYHHLYYFWVIARLGSISKASKKLNLGQPALSAQLKQLEQNLETPLFERSNRRLTLTEAGRVALEYANEIFKLGGEMSEVIRGHSFASSNVHLNLGALDSIPKRILLKILVKAYKKGPCTVSLLEGRGDHLIKDLLTHRLDLLISNFQPHISDNSKLTSKSILKSSVIICGHKKYLPLAKGFPKSLNGQPFVLPTNHSRLRHDIDLYLKSQNVQIFPVAETQDTSLQKLLGCEGVGLVPLATAAAEDVIKEKKLYRIGTAKNVFEEIWLISSARKIENPIAAALFQMGSGLF